MERVIYISVHEAWINFAMITQSPALFRSAPAWQEINRLRECGEEIILLNGSPRFPPQELPSPSPDLVVRVMGAYRHECVQAQYNALHSKGYAVEIHEPACI